MKRILSSLSIVAAAATLCVAASTASFAQVDYQQKGGAAAPAAAAPAAPAAALAPVTHPDLNGIWAGGVGKLNQVNCGKTVDAFPQDDVSRFAAGGATGGKKWITFEQDCGVQHRGHVNVPQYKPEFWGEVRLRDYYADAGGKFIDYVDPEWTNLPQGVPRMGPPNRIVQTADHVFFLYEYNNLYRSIPTDCRDFDPVLRYDQTFMGLAVGCWKDDTLVVTSVGFTDQTWLDWPGYYHSDEMKVTETFQRKGDQLVYNVTVEDPMFLEPWKMDQRVMNLNKDPSTELMQDIPYIDHSLGHLVDPNYRG